MKAFRWRLWRAVLAGMLSVALGSAALGQEASSADDLRTTVEAMKQRIKDQDRRIVELESAKETGQQQKISREEITKILKELNADADKRPVLPKWMENLTFGGDFRLRYDGQYYDWHPDSFDTNVKPRNRARYRLRFGFVKTWLDDQMEVGFRLASGNNNDPTSTNQTFGETASNEPPFAKRPIWIDLAYAKWAPKNPKGLTVIGGKMKNPLIISDLFFDSDVNPEGFWVEYKVPGLGSVEPFAGAGYFVLNERASMSTNNTDSTLAAYQVGVNWKVAKDVKYTFATNLQEYDQYDQSTASPRGNDSPLSRINRFRVLNFSNTLELGMFKVPVALLFDAAHNFGAEDNHGQYGTSDNAWAGGIKVGKNKVKGDWSAGYRYAYVGANSMPGYFVDSDFNFANRQGHVIGAQYNILDCLTAGVNVYLTQPIFTPTTTTNAMDENLTTTVLADLIWKF